MPHKSLKKTPEQALEEFAVWLRRYHSKYTIEDVRPSDTRGFLETVKPCNCTDGPFSGYVIGWPSGKSQAHYHTLTIEGEYRKGYGRGPLAFWRAVNDALNAKYPQWQQERKRDDQ